jgi:very-short-patch-repair endonuclease
MEAPRFTVTRARVLRKTMTTPEVRLWIVLRRSGQGGLRFRRQHPLDAYILDFYCASAHLAVEIDSEGHGFADQLLHDERRDAWMARQGILTLRVPASEVMGNLDGVVQAIVLAAQGRG